MSSKNPVSKDAVKSAGIQIHAALLLYRKNVAPDDPSVVWDNPLKEETGGRGEKEGKNLEGRILEFFVAQWNLILLGGMAILILLSVLQTAKMSRTNRQLKYLTEKLAGYLKAVLEDEAEDALEEQEQQAEESFVSRQEKDMREALELQKQQKKMKDAQLFDAVLSEIYP